MPRDIERVVVCLALAGASEPSHLEAARRHTHPYCAAIIVPDAQAACIGVQGGHDGGIVVIGTGTIGWAELRGRQHRVAAGVGPFPMKEAAPGSVRGVAPPLCGLTTVGFSGRTSSSRCLPDSGRIRIRSCAG